MELVRCFIVCTFEMLLPLIILPLERTDFLPEQSCDCIIKGTFHRFVDHLHLNRVGLREGMYTFSFKFFGRNEGPCE